MFFHTKLFSIYIKYFFCFLFIIINTYIVNGQCLSYSIKKGDRTIGQIYVTRVIKNEITEYNFESNVKLSLFYNDIEIFDRMKSTFKGNQMLKAQLYRTLNGRVKVNNTATWNGKSYLMTNKDGENDSIQHRINLTTTNMYYCEPKNATSIFSDKFQKMIPIKHESNSKYLLNLPNGNKVSYSYKNGICNLVEAETDWATVRFVLNTTKVKNGK